MEAAGLASSIISILDLTAKVVMRAREYMITAKKSPEFLRTIENQLPLLAKCLEGIKIQALGLRITNEIAFDLSMVVDNAFKELQRVDQFVRMLKPEDRSSSLAKFDKAVKSVLKYDAKIQSSMTKLRGYLDTLTLYQSSIAAGKTDDLLQSIRSLKRGQAKLLTKARIDDIKQWIDGAPRDDYIDNCISKKAPGTCEWIFDTAAYIEWKLRPSGGKSKFLWIHGPPGFGKTYVSATICSRLSQSTEPLAAVFWTSEGKFANSSLNDIPRSWVAQLLAQDEALFENVDAIRARSRMERANSKDIWEILQVLLRTFVHPATLVIDGLDEYQQQQAQRKDRLIRNHEASLKYTSVREFLQDLKTNVSGIPCKIVCISQQEAEIQAELTLNILTSDGVQGFEHNITKDNVKQDVKTYSLSMIEGKLPKKTALLKNDLADLVASKAEGQMVWISWLQRDKDFLRPSFNDKKLRNIVENTPPGLDHIYQSNLDRILKLPDGDKSRALRMLHWVMHALRPLTVQELVEAILIESDEDNTNDDDAEFPNDELPEDPDEEDVFGEIKDLCGNFITFDIDETKKNPRHWKLRFSHSSIRAFLIKHLPSDGYGTSQTTQEDYGSSAVIGDLCLRYLIYQNVWPEQMKDAPEDGPGVLYLPEHPFLTYAATYWPLHLTEKCRPHMEPLMSSFFRLHYDNFKTWQKLNRNTKDFNKAGLADRNQWLYKSRLAFASALAAEKIVEELCDLGDEIDHDESYPLYFACASGSVATCRLLHNRGAGLEKVLFDGWRPLHRAAFLGKIDVVKFLISNGVDVNPVAGNGRTPLHSAASAGHDDIVSVLIAAGADPLCMDNNERQPLYYAIQQKHPKTATTIMNDCKNLIDQMVNHMADDGWTPLGTAAWNGDKEMVQLLLQYGANPLQICNWGRTPLYHSAEQGHHDVFVIIFDKCDNVAEVVNKVTELYGYSLLHAAVLGKNLEIVKILLDKGADVSRHDNYYNTPLDEAVFRGLREIVDLLLDVTLEVASYKFWNPLMDSTEAGNVELTRMLLDRGVDPTATDTGGHSPLMYASRWGHHEVVKMLLDHPGGSKMLEKKDGEGYTCLMWACEEGRSQVVKILLEAGADPTVRSDGGLTSILDMAAYSGDVSTVSVLLEECGSASFPEKAVLHGAAESGNEGMFNLLRTYYSINTETLKSGWTILHAAARGGNVKIIKTVLAEGSKSLLSIRDARGHLSMYQAVESTKVDAVKLLLQEYAKYTPPLMFDVDDVLLAAYCGILENVEALYNSDAVKFKSARKGRWTPLHIACRRGHDKIATFLIKKGFDITGLNDFNESCLHFYTFTGSTNIAKLFEDIDWKKALAISDKFGKTPLLQACDSGTSQAFRQLRKHGANLHDVNDLGWSYSYMMDKGLTALHYAASAGSIEIAKLIIEVCGANSVTRKTPLNVYPIHHAVYSEFMVEYLLDHGASLEVENIYKQTPLYSALSGGSNLGMTALLRHGAGEIERKKDSLIMAYAACNYFFPTLKLLHTDGFKLESKLTDGQNLLHIAASRGADDNIDYLVEQGFRWDVKDHHGWTAEDCTLLSTPVPSRDAPPEELKKLDLPYLPPSQWAFQAGSSAVFKPGQDDMEAVFHVDSTDTEIPRAFTLTADHYLLPTPSQSYFEVRIDECPPTSRIAVGLDVFIGEHHRPLGIVFRSMAIYGEDGSFYHESSNDWDFTTPFGQGDVIGCGVDYTSQCVFFTKNGKCLGQGDREIKGRLVPAISTIEKSLKVTANFGQKKFEFTSIESHGYGNTTCSKCYGPESYWSIWDHEEWFDPDSDKVAKKEV